MTTIKVSIAPTDIDIQVFKDEFIGPQRTQNMQDITRRVNPDVTASLTCSYISLIPDQLHTDEYTAYTSYLKPVITAAVQTEEISERAFRDLL